MSTSNYDHLFKLLIIGDTFVGKSALINQLIQNSFADRYIETVGIDFKIRTITVDGIRVRFQIWDTAGIAQLNTVTPAYYFSSVGVILVYNIADRDSFESLQSWLQIVDEYACDNVEKIIIGNKTDLEEYRQVSFAEGRHLATMNRALFFETSAKTNINIMMAFNALARRILSNCVLTQVTAFHPPANCTPTSIPKTFCGAVHQRSHRGDRSNHHHHHHHHKPSCCYIS